MKKILICVNPYISHFYATLALASKFKQKGIEVCYLGFPAIKDIVVSAGYSFFSLESCSPDTFSVYKNKLSASLLSQNYKVLHEEIEGYIKQINPSIILFPSSRFYMFFLPIHNSKKKFLLYSTGYSGVQANLSIPPCRTKHIPRNIDKKSIYVLLLWIFRYIKYDLKLNKVLLEFKYPKNRIKKIVKKENIKSFYSMDGFFCDYPKILLGPSELEFKKQDNWLYAGLGNHQNNNIQSADMNDINNFISSSNTPIVYCCFGTANHKFPKFNMFLEELLNLFQRRTDLRLIISLGKKGATINYKTNSSNILIKDFVNQYQVLQISDVALFHGGFGTLKECISTCTPMLVFPCCYDQFGNAARIQYHKLGLIDNSLKMNFGERAIKNFFKKINISRIEHKIDVLLSNPLYKKNLSDLLAKINRFDALDETVNYIINLSNTEGVFDYEKEN